MGSARSGAGHPNLKDSPERGLTPCPWSCYNMITGQDPNEEDSKMSELKMEKAGASKWKVGFLTIRKHHSRPVWLVSVPGDVLFEAATLREAKRWALGPEGQKQEKKYWDWFRS